MFVPLSDSPLKVFCPVQLFCALSFATFGDRRASLMRPAVAGSLMAETMAVPVIDPPPPVAAVVGFAPSGKKMPVPGPLHLRLPATAIFSDAVGTAPTPTLPVALSHVR